MKRIICPGELVHVVVCWVNGEYRLRTTNERNEYLRLLGRASGKSDWHVLAFALMSTHVHLALLAGRQPFGRLARRIHPTFARWLNTQQHRRGPLMAKRPDTYPIDPTRAARLVAYLHNNPVRAGLCDDGTGSTWTSHRAYMGLVEAPPWLRVNHLLRSCGFDTATESRKAFHDYVCKMANEPEDWIIGSRELRTHGKEARQALGSALNLGYPHLQPQECQAAYPIVTSEGIPLHPRWDGPLAAIVEHVAQHTGIVAKRIQARDRKRTVVRARRLIMLIARHELGRGLSESSRIVGITPPSGLRLIDTATAKDWLQARELTEIFLANHH